MAALSERHHGQSRVALRRVGARLERALELGARLRQAAGVEMNGADVLVRHRVRGIDLQTTIEDGQRLRRAPGSRQRDAERVQRVERRICGGRLLEQGEGLGGAADIGEVRPELHLRSGRRLDPVGGAQHIDCRRGIAAAPVVEREMTRSRHHVRPPRENAAVERDGGRGVAALVVRHRVVHLPVHVDQDLRVVGVRISGLPTSRSRHVAKRLQAASGVGIGRRRHARLRRAKRG